MHFLEKIEIYIFTSCVVSLTVTINDTTFVVVN